MRGGWLVGVALTATLVGCGGGGGGGSGGGGPTVSPALPGTGVALPPDMGTAPAPSAPAVPNPPQTGSAADYETAEYQANWGLADVNASTAYAHGANGQGVTVGIVDTGVSATNPDLAGAIDANSADVVARAQPDPNGVGQHGTWVASVLGARRNGGDTMGVAWNSTILGVRADSPGSCPDACSFTDSALATATDYATSHGAKIVNYSLGGSGPLDADLQTAMQNAVAAQRILIFAAGNTGGSILNPASFAATAASLGQAIAVGAVDSNNHIASFSAQAGSAADHFLVAPGVGILATGFDGALYSVSGTSFAAPMVAGAAADLWSVAPYLTPKQVVDLLLTTATPLGPSSVYGHGLLNLAAALLPQGTPQLATGTSVDGPAAALPSTSLALGAAFGNSLQGSRLIHQAMILDAYQRAYTADLSAMIVHAEAMPDSSRLFAPEPLRQSVEGLSFAGMSLHMDTIHASADATQPSSLAAGLSFAGGDRLDVGEGVGLGNAMGLASMGREESFLGRDAFRSPFLDMAGAGMSVVVGHDLGQGRWLRFGYGGHAVGLTAAQVPDDGPADARDPHLDEDRNTEAPARHRRALAAEWGTRLPLGGRLALQAGSLHEEGTILDTDGEGGFATGGGSADTAFGGAMATMPLGGSTDLFGSYSHGWTRAATPAGAMLSDFRGLTSESMGVGATTRRLLSDDDRLTLSLSQPLRVGGGSAVLDLPVARTLDGTVLRGQENLDLAPDGRELDFELKYLMWNDQRGELGFNLLTALQPGHDAAATPAGMAGVRYRLRW